jgi:hypothetical protein
MQATINLPAIPTAVSQTDAQRVAQQYVASQIDLTFTVVKNGFDNGKLLGRELWRFGICCQQDPLTVLSVDAQTGQVIEFTHDEIRVVREKAAIYAARKQGVLPVNEHGYVVGEYARREADGYLGDTIGMFFNAIDPTFLSINPSRWQVTIIFRRYHLGPFTLGIIDVDAQTGEPIPLTPKQIQTV